MVDLPEELQQLKRFHGHLGPYVVVGYRMGRMARSRLQGRMHATVMTGGKPPLSCVVDGIQFSSSCTMGKGNISIEERGQASAVFVDDRRVLEIRLEEEIKAVIDGSMSRETEESIALAVFEEDAAALFHITEVESSQTERTLKLR
jgi:formylmethanofuran dehydrogenase subunit E